MSVEKRVIRSLAKIAVGSAFGWPWGGASTAAKEAVDFIISGLPERNKNDFEEIVERLSNDLEALVESEGLSSDVFLPVASNTEIIFQNGTLTASDWIESKLEPNAAAEVLIKRNIDFINRLGDPVEGLCVKLVHTVCQVLLSDKSVLSSLDLAFKQTVLNRLDALQTLPQQVADVLKSIACNALLSIPNIEYSDRIFSPSIMLRADCGIVPYYPRNEMTADLEAWCEMDLPVAVRLYTGPGGMGKTRFFIETCRFLRKKDWLAGFLSSEKPDVPEEILDALIHMGKRLFIVIDYAERRRIELVRLLKRILINYKSLHIRLILIARSAEDWWISLSKKGTIVGELLTGPSTTIFQIPPLGDDVEDRKIVFDAAVEAFAEKLGNAVPDFTHPNLEADHFKAVLFIHMSALAAAQGKVIEYPDDLLDFVLGRERDIWRGQIQSDGLPNVFEDTLGQYAALITLAGGAANRAEASALAGRAPLFGGQPEAVRNQIAKLLRGMYPGNRWIEGLQPDLLGEHFVQEEISKDLSLLDAAVAEDAGENQIENALTVLTRLCAHYPDGDAWLENTLDKNPARLALTALKVAMETGDPIGRILARVMEAHPLPELAERIMERVPEQTVALRELGAVATEQCLEALLSHPSPRPEAIQIEIAVLHNNLANRLSDLGRREEALQNAQEAVTIRRQLAEARPDAFLPYLATSLNNLANFLSDLGRREEALQNAQEAVTIYRQLAEARPDAFLPDLAMSLNNLANRLSALGRREEALQNAQEAVTIRRQLAEARPDAFLPYLATSLNNLANFLSDLGRREEALQNAQEAVTIYRQLAEARPDAFLPDLAGSLNNLANRLSDLGRREEALQNAQEAVTIYRQLAEARPDAFLPDLATSLNNLANFLSDLGRREEALQNAQEAVTIRRQLAEARPDAFLPDLAMSLNNLANRLSALGRREEALQNAQEAVTIRRQLAEARPDAFLPDLAMSLNNLANRLSDLGRREEALQNAQEAVTIYRQLAEARPDAFLPDLATSLNNLANFLSDLGRREEALQNAQEAVTIRRQLAEARPDAFLPDLATSLNNLANFLSDLGRREEALQNAQEAVTIRRQLAEARPDAFLQDLAMSLGTLSICFESADRNEDALSSVEEAIEAIKPLFFAEARIFAELMAKLIKHYTDLAQRSNLKPNIEFLIPVLDVFNNLQGNESEEKK